MSLNQQNNKICIKIIIIIIIKNRNNKINRQIWMNIKIINIRYNQI